MLGLLNSLGLHRGEGRASLARVIGGTFRIVNGCEVVELVARLVQTGNKDRGVKRKEEQIKPASLSRQGVSVFGGLPFAFLSSCWQVNREGLRGRGCKDKKSCSARCPQVSLLDSCIRWRLTGGGVENVPGPCEPWPEGDFRTERSVELPCSLLSASFFPLGQR